MSFKKETFSSMVASVNITTLGNIPFQNNSKFSNHNAAISAISIKFKPFLGIFYAFMCSLFLSLLYVFVKQLSHIDPGELSLVRNAAVWAGCLPIAVYTVKDVFGKKGDIAMLILRGILIGTSTYLNTLAISCVPLAVAAVVMSTTPAVSTIMARVYLKEPCGLVEVIAIIMTCCGIMLYMRLPQFTGNGTHVDLTYLGGLASAFGYVILLSTSLVALRKMKQIHFSVSLIYVGFIGMLENAIINMCTSNFSAPKCGGNQILLIAMGILAFLGYIAQTLAVQKEAIGIVSVIRSSSDIVLAMIFQIAFFKRSPDIYEIVGACVVIISISMIGLKKWIITLPDESKVRNKFKYILK